MACYLLIDLDVHDHAAMARYLAEIPAVIARHGGRYLARGGPAFAVEGTRRPGRVTVLEFPDRASFDRFHASAEFQALARLRQSASTGSLIMVEGI
jgi:uncharacterized protein (DUF1330 family)